MNESVLAASPSGQAAGPGHDTTQPQASITLAPGVGTTAWITTTSGAARVHIHLFPETLREVLFSGHTVCIDHAAGAVILHPTGPVIEIRVYDRADQGAVYLITRRVFETIARGVGQGTTLEPVRE